MMSNKRHYTIPIFVPELACPHQCVFCNQREISGQHHIPRPQEIRQTIDDYLASMPQGNRWVEVGFFGGSFTGIPMAQQTAYLSIAHHYLKNGKIQGIRLSTRPDYIDSRVLDMLNSYGVSTIELGAQSTHDSVLRKSGRGHSRADIRNASEAIVAAGFRLGLQMMIGLPGDSYELSMQTAHDIADWGAHESRIYPCLVVKNTQLAQQYSAGRYQPLPLAQAVSWSKDIWLFLESRAVKVIRIGLHASEAFDSGEGLLAGPYHPSFKALVLTELWHDIISHALIQQAAPKNQLKTIYVPPQAMAVAVGQSATNKQRLQAAYGAIKIKPQAQLKDRECYVDIS